VFLTSAALALVSAGLLLLNGVAMFRPLPMPAIDGLALHVADAQVAAGDEVFHQAIQVIAST
jgi:hypothetical protein